MIPAPDETVDEQLEETLSQAAPPVSQADSKPESSGKGKAAAKPQQAKNAEPAGEKPADPAPADELPEEFELTPEIVEDEALRNDFMLRLAVVLMAVLLACTEIGETDTLVHIKTGQYLASHGILPPATDVLTRTAGDKPWINLSWLFDLLAAGTFAVGGAAGLTVVKTLLAGLTFFLFLKTVKRDVPTWWATICAGLALIVCAEQLTFEPQLITLLGLSLTLWILARWQQGVGKLWLLVPVFLVWSNLDPRAYLGLVVLMLLTLGELAGVFVGRSFLQDETQRGQLWLIVPLAVLAFLINPFGWHSLLSPASLYGLEYPAWRELLQNPGGSLESYLPLTDPDFWRNLTLPVITALVLAATVPVTFLLNWRNVSAAHVLLYLGMLGIGLANSHDLAAVSLILAVLAAQNAQEWYAESFRQSYSVELSERVFSVGGRAVTALAFFGLAFLAISGRLLGGDANRLGFGFRESLTSLIQEVQKDLDATEIPGQGLNFSLRQGDVLIWLDQKPYIDTRLNLYAQGGPDSLWAEYKNLIDTWTFIRQKDESEEDAGNRVNEMLALRQRILEKRKIRHAIVPLGPRVPQYGRLRSFIADSGQWRLVRLGSMAGWFYMLTRDPEKNQAYLEKHEASFLKQAFQTPVEGVTYQPSLASAPAKMDQMLLLKANKPNSPETQLALHYRLLVHDRWNAVMENQARQRATSFAELLNIIGLAHLSIRHAHNALREDPNAVPAYHALADCCGQLNGLEEQVSQLLGGTVQANQQRRYFQAVVAYNQAITAAPDQAYLHLELGNLYNQNNRLDLALREFNRFLEITGPPQGDDEAAQAEYERRLRIKKDIETKVELVQTEIDKHLENKVPGRQLAPLAMQNRCVLMGLELLKEDGELPPHDAGVLISQLEAGFVEEAYSGLMQLKAQLDAQITTAKVKQFGLAVNPQVRQAIAMGALSVGDYDEAIAQWTRQAEESEQRAMLMLMGTLPMVNRPIDPIPLFMQLSDDSPLTTWLTGRGFVGQMSLDTASPLWNAALCQLEVGRPKEAADLLKKLLEIQPESAFRPLAVFYIGLTTQEPYDLEPPSFQVPVWEGMFASGPAIAEKPIREPAKPTEKPVP